MLGLLRTTLALMVVTFHLLIELSPLGTYSVFGFYLISGYLMTLIMHDNYGYTGSGRLAFAANRLLRLYPSYWLAALGSAALIIGIGPATVLRYHDSLFLPQSLKDYLSNASMLFPAWLPNSVDPRLVPPAWALTVELFFYVAIGLGISKHPRRIKVWLLLSVAYVIGTYLLETPLKQRYAPIAAGSLPFAVGSALYFLAKEPRVYQLYVRSRLRARHLFMALLANCLLWTVLTVTHPGLYLEIGFYLNIGICALLVYSLAKGDKIATIPAAADKVIGDFAYPVYLWHWQAGLAVSYLLYGEAFHELSGRGAIVFLSTLLVVAVLSLMTIYLVDIPIQRLRTKIRAMNRPAGRDMPGRLR